MTGVRRVRGPRRRARRSRAARPAARAERETRGCAGRHEHRRVPSPTAHGHRRPERCAGQCQRCGDRSGSSSRARGRSSRRGPGTTRSRCTLVPEPTWVVESGQTSPTTSRRRAAGRTPRRRRPRRRPSRPPSEPVWSTPPCRVRGSTTPTTDATPTERFRAPTPRPSPSASHTQTTPPQRSSPDRRRHDRRAARRRVPAAGRGRSPRRAGDAVHRGPRGRRRPPPAPGPRRARRAPRGTTAGDADPPASAHGCSRRWRRPRAAARHDADAPRATRGDGLTRRHRPAVLPTAERVGHGIGHVGHSGGGGASRDVPGARTSPSAISAEAGRPRRGSPLPVHADDRHRLRAVRHGLVEDVDEARQQPGEGLVGGDDDVGTTPDPDDGHPGEVGHLTISCCCRCWAAACSASAFVTKEYPRHPRRRPRRARCSRRSASRCRSRPVGRRGRRPSTNACRSRRRCVATLSSRNGVTVPWHGVPLPSSGRPGRPHRPPGPRRRARRPRPAPRRRQLRHVGRYGRTSAGIRGLARHDRAKALAEHLDVETEVPHRRGAEQHRDGTRGGGQARCTGRGPHARGGGGRARRAAAARRRAGRAPAAPRRPDGRHVPADRSDRQEPGRELLDAEVGALCRDGEGTGASAEPTTTSRVGSGMRPRAASVRARRSTASGRLVGAPPDGAPRRRARSRAARRSCRARSPQRHGVGRRPTRRVVPVRSSCGRRNPTATSSTLVGGGSRRASVKCSSRPPSSPLRSRRRRGRPRAARVGQRLAVGLGQHGQSSVTSTGRVPRPPPAEQVRLGAAEPDGRRHGSRCGCCRRPPSPPAGAGPPAGRPGVFRRGRSSHAVTRGLPIRSTTNAWVRRSARWSPPARPGRPRPTSPRRRSPRGPTDVPFGNRVTDVESAVRLHEGDVRLGQGAREVGHRDDRDAGLGLGVAPDDARAVEPVHGARVEAQHDGVVGRRLGRWCRGRRGGRGADRGAVRTTRATGGVVEGRTRASRPAVHVVRRCGDGAEPCAATAPKAVPSGGATAVSGSRPRLRDAVSVPVARAQGRRRRRGAGHVGDDPPAWRVRPAARRRRRRRGSAGPAHRSTPRPGGAAHHDRGRHDDAHQATHHEGHDGSGRRHDRVREDEEECAERTAEQAGHDVEQAGQGDGSRGRDDHVAQCVVLGAAHRRPSSAPQSVQNRCPGDDGAPHRPQVVTGTTVSTTNDMPHLPSARRSCQTEGGDSCWPVDYGVGVRCHPFTGGEEPSSRVRMTEQTERMRDEVRHGGQVLTNLTKQTSGASGDLGTLVRRLATRPNRSRAGSTEPAVPPSTASRPRRTPSPTS